MAYSTLNDLIAASSAKDILELTDDARIGEINEGFVSEAVSKADALIDSYVSGRYRVPIAAPVPLIIGDISAQLAIYYLYERRFRADMPESIMKIYQNLIAQLKAVHDGMMDIPAETLGNGIMGSGPSRCNKTAADRLFPWSRLNEW